MHRATSAVLRDLALCTIANMHSRIVQLPPSPGLPDLFTEGLICRMVGSEAALPSALASPGDTKLHRQPSSRLIAGLRQATPALLAHLALLENSNIACPHCGPSTAFHGAARPSD